MVIERAELAKRASRVRLVLADCDGVLTDGAVMYGAEGEAFKRFSFRDGMGVALLRAAGIEVGIVTGESSPIVRARAQKLGITCLYEGARDKELAVRDAAETRGLLLENVAFIGDDVNDLPAFGVLDGPGLTGAPADAMTRVRERAHYVCEARGGHGAFRELAELVLLFSEGR
jgi:3-deoxy-D-manno-octulosonate 8-phosphate phosphatase (KDO 8-P phosphatase)